MLPSTFTPQLLRQLEMLKINTRRSMLGARQGIHRSHKRGHGLEFADYRKYELGDNPRHIDWGLYARTERLYIKTFQEEQNISLLILVDTTASMFNPSEDRKWQRARDLALAVAYVALMQQDTVQLCPLGGAPSPFFTGGAAIHRVSDLLDRLNEGSRINLVEATKTAVSKVRLPGLCVFLSDFLNPLEEIEATINVLRSKNLDITAIQILGQNDIEPLKGMESVTVVDSESSEEIGILLDGRARRDYAELLRKHTDELGEFLAENRISYVRTRADSSFAQSLIEDISEAGLFK